MRFLSRADEYLLGAFSEAQAGRHTSAASLAIHAAIAANDAVCLHIGHRVGSSGKDHRAAAKNLVDSCRGTPLEKDAAVRAEQLKQLLAQKTDVEYSSRSTGADEAQRILRRAERFVSWARAVTERPS